MTTNDSYTQDVERIKAIIEKLKGDCDIDEMLQNVNEAAELIEKCQTKLGQSGVKIREVLDHLKSIEESDSGED